MVFHHRTNWLDLFCLIFLILLCIENSQVSFAVKGGSNVLCFVFHFSGCWNQLIGNKFCSIGVDIGIINMVESRPLFFRGYHCLTSPKTTLLLLEGRC